MSDTMSGWDILWADTIDKTIPDSDLELWLILEWWADLHQALKQSEAKFRAPGILKISEPAMPTDEDTVDKINIKEQITNAWLRYYKWIEMFYLAMRKALDKLWADDASSQVAYCVLNSFAWNDGNIWLRDYPDAIDFSVVINRFLRDWTMPNSINCKDKDWYKMISKPRDFLIDNDQERETVYWNFESIYLPFSVAIASRVLLRWEDITGSYWNLSLRSTEEVLWNLVWLKDGLNNHNYSGEWESWLSYWAKISSLEWRLDSLKSDLRYNWLIEKLEVPIMWDKFYVLCRTINFLPTNPTLSSALAFVDLYIKCIEAQIVYIETYWEDMLEASWKRENNLIDIKMFTSRQLLEREKSHFGTQKAQLEIKRDWYKEKLEKREHRKKILRAIIGSIIWFPQNTYVDDVNDYLWDFNPSSTLRIPNQEYQELSWIDSLIWDLGVYLEKFESFTLPTSLDEVWDKIREADQILDQKNWPNWFNNRISQMNKQITSAESDLDKEIEILDIDRFIEQIKDWEWWFNSICQNNGGLFWVKHKKVKKQFDDYLLRKAEELWIYWALEQ